MAGKIKGIELEIGGNTTRLTQALKDVDKQLGATRGELKAVDRLLKFDPENTELLAQKEKLLGNQFELNKKKLEALKAAKESADSEMKSGTEINEKQYRKLNREIAATEISLKKFSKGSEELTGSAKKTAAGLENVSDAAEAAEKSTSLLSKGFTVAKGAVSGFIVEGVKTLVGNIRGAIEASNEYRREISLLNAASERNGYTADEAAEGFKYLYSILGDQTQARTALNNAQALKLSQEELLELLHSAVGAWGAYGDSIPIDGLMESVNETAKVGKITGVLADALNWAGINEDSFNEKLEKCSDEQSRQKLITQALKEQYSALASSYEKNNAGLIAQNESTIKQNESAARLGKVFDSLKIKTLAVKDAFLDSLASVAEKFDTNKRAVEEMSEAYKNAEEERAESLNSSLAETEYTNRLADELMRLADENGNVTEANKERVQFILGELNGALGTEYTMVDNQIQKYGDLRESIYDTINAKKLSILLESQEEAYAEAINNKAEAQKNANDAYTEYAGKLAEIKTKEEELKEIQNELASLDTNDPDMYYWGEKLSAVSTEINRLQANAEDLKAVYDAAAETYGNYALNIETYEEATRIAAEKGTTEAVRFLEERNAAYINAEKIAEECEESTLTNIGRLGAEYQNALLELNSSLELYLKSGSNSAANAVTAALEAVEAKKKDYIAAGADIKDGIISAIDGGGKPIEADLSNLSSGIEKKLSELKTKAKPQGENLVLGLVEGIDAQNDKNAAYVAAAEFSKRLLNILPKKADMHSPSKETEKQGENLVLGVAVGISNAEIKAVTAMEGVYSDIARVAENAQLDEEKKREKARKRELSNLKNALDLELITETDYYTELKKYRDKYCEQGSEDWYNYTVQIIKYNKKVADELEKENANVLKNIRAKMSDALSANDRRADIYDTEYELWGYENPYAAADTKNEKNIELLTNKIENQKAAVKTANDALWEAKQLTGENSDESAEFQIQLNKEKIELEKLNDELEEAVRLKAKLYESNIKNSVKAAGKSATKLAPLKEGQKIGQETVINITNNYQGYKGTISENNAALKKTLKNAEVTLS